MSDDLRLLAEASPTAFLDCLDGALASEPSPVLALFRTDEGVVHPTQYVSDLLWALELLCWSTDHFGRAVMALARLADMDPDPDSKMRNRPLESLKGIFLLWHPQTHASPDDPLVLRLGLLHRRSRNAHPLASQSQRSFVGLFSPVDREQEKVLSMETRSE